MSEGKSASLLFCLTNGVKCKDLTQTKHKPQDAVTFQGKCR